MTTALATTTGAARRVVQGHEEFTFNDIGELCAFLQHEIQSSKRKYKAIAEKAGCCPQTVSNMASGTTLYPRAGTVFAMLRVLGYEVVVRG